MIQSLIFFKAITSILLLIHYMVKYKKMKVLPFHLESDGGYRLTLSGKENDVRAYFNPSSNELESIVFIQSDMRSEVSEIILSIEDVLNLDIGNQNSASFDLR